MNRKERCFSLGAALVVALFTASPVTAKQVVLASAGSQPAADAVKPGLMPTYFYGTRYDFVSEFYDRPKSKGKPGPPLLQVNYRSGSGRVLTSEDVDWVGARIEGYIKLDAPGVYEFAMESNDGVRLEVEGKLVVEDPGVHFDQFSDVGTVQITEPGWYALTIWYFEKENTSTLRFLWKRPDGDPDQGLKMVPEEVLAHVPGA